MQSRATFTTFLPFSSTTARYLLRRRLDRISTSIYRDNVTYVHTFVQAVLTFEFELLGFEFVALLNEIVDRLFAINFDRFMRLFHVPKVLQNVLIKLAHYDFFVVLLEIATVNHLVNNFNQCCTQHGGPVNFHLLLLVVSILVCLIVTAFHHIFSKIRL